MEGSVQVHVDHGAPGVERQLLRRCRRTGDASVVDQDVKASELPMDIVEELVDGGGVADVGDRTTDVLAAGTAASTV